jgi:hypothetical protein
MSTIKSFGRFGLWPDMRTVTVTQEGFTVLIVH